MRPRVVVKADAETTTSKVSIGDGRQVLAQDGLCGAVSQTTPAMEKRLPASNVTGAADDAVAAGAGKTVRRSGVTASPPGTFS